jgi:hypothetical protein
MLFCKRTLFCTLEKIILIEEGTVLLGCRRSYTYPTLTQNITITCLIVYHDYWRNFDHHFGPYKVLVLTNIWFSNHKIRKISSFFFTFWFYFCYFLLPLSSWKQTQCQRITHKGKINYKKHIDIRYIDIDNNWHWYWHINTNNNFKH